MLKLFHARDGSIPSTSLRMSQSPFQLEARLLIDSTKMLRNEIIKDACSLSSVKIVQGFIGKALF
jgi:hypothetical protein